MLDPQTFARKGDGSLGSIIVSTRDLLGVATITLQFIPHRTGFFMEKRDTKKESDLKDEKETGRMVCTLYVGLIRKYGLCVSYGGSGSV